MFSLLICDDHPPIRTALRLMVRGATVASDVTETSNARELLEALHSRKHFDMLVLDLQLPGLSGLDAIAQVRQLRPQLSITVLSADERPETVDKALLAGASRYFFKSVSESVLFQALRDAAGALPHATATPQTDFADAAPPDDGLSMTARQREVLKCLLSGMSGKQIARALNLSEGTVKSHTVAVFRSLNVRSRAQAIIEAHRRGLNLAP